jgi:hypothetical protein
MPKLPTPDAYNEAVQAPLVAFPDPVLASGRVDCNGFGIPRALGGGFAITYRLVTPGSRTYAVRCFHKESPNLQNRYQSIHNYLGRRRLRPFVEFEYQHNGIRVRGKPFPIVKMAWVSGTTLGEHIERIHDKPTQLDGLRAQFATLEQELAIGGIAHGDLQNGNVLVNDGQLRLVDYDGMFVRGMPLGSGTELGHKHFQHPLRRTGDFGPDMDRFSFIVIDLSLQALRYDQGLFSRFSTGENILFSANDFVDPDTSQVFRALQQIGDTQFRESVTDFACVCKADVSLIPKLSDFRVRRAIPRTASPHVRVPIVRHEYIGALPVLDAASFKAACRHIGDRVELVGQVVEVKCGSTRRETPYVFVNFGHWKHDCVSLTIWSEGLKALGYTPDQSWIGAWIVANGMVDPVYHGKTIAYRKVGITIQDRSQIRKVSEAEAMWRLGKAPQPDRSPITTTEGDVAAANDRVREKLQGGRGKGKQKPISSTRHSPPQPSGGSGHASVQSKNQQILGSIRRSAGAGKTPVILGQQKNVQPGWLSRFWTWLRS